jgi:branched-chain amino acid transport system substrate-binding protein
MKRRDLVVAIGGLAGSSWGAKAQTKPTSERIVLGQSAALTGPASALGTQFKLGAEIYFEKVNAQGGVAGRKIELKSLDDGYEPERCIRNTRELIESGAAALFGYVGTVTSLAALPLASEAKRVFFAPFTGSEALRIPFNRYAFHVRASYVDETNAIVQHLTSVGINRIGVFYQNDGDGKAGLLGVARALRLQYQSPTGLGSVNRNSTDVDAAVRSILSAKPDAIVQISTYQTCAAFIRAARKAGFRGVFYNLSFVGTQALAEELGSEAGGVVVCQVMPFPYEPITRLVGEYLAAAKDKMGTLFKPSYTSIEGYVAAKTLVEGLRRAGPNLSASSLIDGLESLREIDLGGYRIDFGPEKHTASKFIDLTILTQEGRARR